MPRTTLQITKGRRKKTMKFEIPEIMITKFGVEDVITASSLPGTDEDETPGQPGGWD